MIILLTCAWALFGVWGYALGRNRSIGGGAGFLLGLFLSIIGLAIVIRSPKVR